MIQKRIVFIGGAGKIGSAIVKGILSRGAVSHERLVVTARHERSLVEFRKMGVESGTDNAAAVRDADVVLLCVHPIDIDGVLAEIVPHLADRPLIITVATGISTAVIEGAIGRPLPVVRAMPNTAVQVGESMTALTRGRHVLEEDMDIALEIFEMVGEVERLDERHLNAATGLGGCGPAFVFKIIEALSEGGVKMGLPREAARKMAAQTLKGAAEMVLRSGKHPAELKDEVTTPGGCTIDGITKLEERGLPIALIEAVETSSLKAGQLYQGSDTCGR